MYGWKKAAAALGIWAVLTAVFPAVSIAAVKTETRTPITSVSLKVRSDVQADYELNEATVYATTDSSLYTIGAYKWAAKNNKDYWEPGDEPKVQIEIHARSGYYFNRTTGPSKFQIDGATYKSVKRTNNDETLLLTVLLTPASGPPGVRPMMASRWKPSRPRPTSTMRLSSGPRETVCKKPLVNASVSAQTSQ